MSPALKALGLANENGPNVTPQTITWKCLAKDPTILNSEQVEWRSLFCRGSQHLLRTKDSKKFSSGKEFPFLEWQQASFGTERMGHFERGLFTREISRNSKISKFSRISIKWSDLPLHSRVWALCRISRISKSLESLEDGLCWKDPFSKRPLFPNPILREFFWCLYAKGVPIRAWLIKHYR